jgi:hypothetical protein
MISTVIALPYEIARFPLVRLDTGLSGLPQTNGARVALDRAIGTSDQLAGALLRNSAIAERGADRDKQQARAATTRTAAAKKAAATKRATARTAAVAQTKARADSAGTGAALH